MATSNTIKDQILTLFPDNNQQEISAADMRIFVHSIFNTKEEIIIKATNEDDMKSQKSKIYENSVVLISAAGAESGVYVSRANNPISLLQLDKIADLADGGIIPGSALSDFMVEYQHNKTYLNAAYSYQDNNISNINLSDQGVQIYDINFTYENSNISQTAIQEVNGQQVIISYEYSNGNIATKIYTI